VKLGRLPRRADPQRLPQPVTGEEGRYLIDACWGTVQPMQLVDGVRTVGELEVVEHIQGGGAVVDSRLREYLAGGVLPGAVGVPHDEVLAHRERFDPAGMTVLYCNGPQCPASPDAITALLGAGQPPESLLYYRGGILDWLATGYVLEVGELASRLVRFTLSSPWSEPSGTTSSLSQPSSAACSGS
jgi:rhodanese-related sulfurtransferase